MWEECRNNFQKKWMGQECLLLSANGDELTTRSGPGAKCESWGRKLGRGVFCPKVRCAMREGTSKMTMGYQQYEEGGEMVFPFAQSRGMSIGGLIGGKWVKPPYSVEEYMA